MNGPSNPGRHSELGAILDKGDDFARAGDHRAALSFYKVAMEAKVEPRSLPAPMIERLRSAQQFINDCSTRFRSTLAQVVADHPGDSPEERLRIAHMLDMLEGRRQIFLQEPNVLFTPYLAQRQFFDPSEFEWSAAIEAATPAIRAELLALIEDEADFQPYVFDYANRPSRPGLALNNDPSWSALYLWRDGQRVPDVADRCPATMAALAHVPLTRIGKRTPSALFSRLSPGAHIPPHHGMLNCRMICHLPLIVPPGCTLRVGNETRAWSEGQLMIFDDSFEHEAHNPSGETRIILLFDAWRPELGAQERAAVSAIFDAIDGFGGVPAEA